MAQHELELPTVRSLGRTRRDSCHGSEEGEKGFNKRTHTHTARLQFRLPGAYIRRTIIKSYVPDDFLHVCFLHFFGGFPNRLSFRRACSPGPGFPTPRSLTQFPPKC